MACIKRWILLGFMLTLLSSNLTEATNHSDTYTHMINNGKYRIECQINSDFSRNETSTMGYYQDVTLLKDKDRGIEYFSAYGHADESKYYQWIELLQYKGRYFARIEWSKKEIDLAMARKKDLKEIKQTHYTFWPYYGITQAQTISRIFSCLGEITAHNNILKNYKAEYKCSGEFQQDGEIYTYDEYVITAPQQAKLQLQYVNGALAYSIKLSNDNEASHPIVFSSKIKEDRIEAIIFKRFDSDIDSLVEKLLARVNKKVLEN